MKQNLANPHAARHNVRQNFGLLKEFMLAVAVIVLIAIMIFQLNTGARQDIAKTYVQNATCNTTTGVYSGCGVDVDATYQSDAAIGQVTSKLKLIGLAVVFGVVIYVITRVVPGAGAPGSNYQ